jgi:hypothetical protein
MTKRLIKGPSREQKADTTTLVALEIIEREQASTAAKTERLRAQRLAHEAANPEPIKTPRKANPQS